MATEREVILRLKADTSGVEKGLEGMEESLSGIDKQLEEIGKSGKTDVLQKKLDELNKKVESGELSMRDLTRAVKEYQTIAVQAGKDSPVGQAAIIRAAELKDSLGDLQTQVNNLGHDGKNMQAALQLGSTVIGGYSAFQGVTALLGRENEDLAKTFVKLQAAQSALAGIEQIRMSLEKESFLMLKAKAIQTNVLSAATAAYNAVIGTSTGVLKLFKIALISTGIGAIIVGVGLLVANFDAVSAAVKRVIKWFGGMGEQVTRLIEWYNEMGIAAKIALYIIAAPIFLLIEAYQLFFGTVEKGTADQMKRERELAEARSKHNQELAAQHKARVEQIKKERDEKLAAIDKEIKALELEKDTLEAQGKSSTAATIQILENEKMRLQTILEANEKLIASYAKYYTDRAKFEGQSEEEFKKQMKAQGIDLDALQEKANSLIQENRDAVQYAENEITKFKREQGEKRSADQKALQDKMIEEQRKFMQLQLELEQQITDFMLANMEDGAEKELAILREKQKRERQALVDKYGEDSDLIKELETKQFNELEDLFDKFDDARIAKEKEFLQQLTDLRIENMAEGRDKELAALREKHRLELEEVRRKYGEQTELEKELLLKQKEEIAAVEAEFDDLARQAKIDKAQETLDTIEGLFNAAQEIVSLLNELGDQERERITARRDADLSELQRNKKAQLSVEGLTAKQKAQIEFNFAMMEYQTKKKAAEEDDKIARKQFNRNKAMKLAEIGINTAAGIMQAIAQFGPPPSPLGIAGIAAAAITGGLQAAVVARQQFQGGAAQISPPNFSDFAVSDTGSGGTQTSSGQGQTGSQQNNTTTNTDSLINGIKPTKVILSMVELNEMQDDMNKIDAVSTIGGG